MEVEFPGLGWEFTIDNVALRIGNFSLYWYAVIIATGMLLAVLYAFKTCKRFGIKDDPMINVIITGVFFALLGARAYYVLFNLSAFDTFWDVINIRDGGMAIYGGVIAAFVSGWIACRVNKVNVMAMFDITGIGFLLGQAIGRWGNFANQEAFGGPTDLPWGMQSINTGNVPVHPCFLYESLWCFAGFIALHFIGKKFYKFKGQLFLMYLLWYGLGRGWIEGLRTDSLWLIDGVIRVSQLLAVVCVVVTVPLLILGFRGKLFQRADAQGEETAAVEGSEETAELPEAAASEESEETAPAEESEEAAPAEESEEAEN
ncbi:MAG: prolipoprotein diacylglyceryl transferase [Ruminococcaceae bacterium]|nr:prolipoprotein diacylglyceryl transferase [Oscillospiraceae bacterium]